VVGVGVDVVVVDDVVVVVVVVEDPGTVEVVLDTGAVELVVDPGTVEVVLEDEVVGVAIVGQGPFVMILVSRVTAPLCANNCPCTVAPVFAVMDAKAKM